MNQQDSAKFYLPVNKCIYCGANSGLTDEHIIPFGLGGELVLPKSSCKECSAITSKAERFCLREMFFPARVSLDIPTRRPQEREELIEKFRYSKSKLKEVETILSIDSPPLAVVGFRFPAPGILRGVWGQDNFEGKLIVRLSDDSKMGGASRENAIKIGSINHLSFAKMLAKIAHSYAIAEFGVDSFIPLLSDLILGKSTNAPDLIGGDVSLSKSEQQDGILHDIYRQDCLSSGVNYILIAVHLFAFMGAPRYHIVVGKRV